MILRVPVDVNAGSLKDWGRKVAQTVNQALARIETLSGGSGISDGDYGDIVVSSSGTAINFDSSVVTAFAKTFLDDANAAAVRTTLGVTGTGADTAYAFRANNLSDLANAGTARTNLGLAIGTDVQAFDADLGALASNATNGLWARTGAGTGAARTITAGSGISVSNGDGVSGNPTITHSGLGGCVATLSADFAGNFQPNVAIAFDGTDQFDDSAYHNPASNNTRLTIPANGTYLIVGNVSFTNLATNEFSRIGIHLNGSATPLAVQFCTDITAPVSVGHSVTLIRQFSASDYVELFCDTEADTSITLAAANTTFGIFRLA